jgi:hypothetical protein
MGVELGQPRNGGEATGTEVETGGGGAGVPPAVCGG